MFTITCAKKIIQDLEISRLCRLKAQLALADDDQITLHVCDCEQRLNQISSLISDRSAGKHAPPRWVTTSNKNYYRIMFHNAVFKHSIMKHNAIIILRDRERDEAKKREEKEEQLRSQTEVAKLSSFADLVPDEPASGNIINLLVKQNAHKTLLPPTNLSNSDSAHSHLKF
eukprot:sb/3472172/